jgi:transcriptional regulator GlxA family with amidase domain
MHIAILTFDGFNELDSFIALGILNRVRKPDWRVSITCPASRVKSMNGVVIESQAPLSEAACADVVLVGSGTQTREVVADSSLMAQLRLDPQRQLLGAQCSGTLVLAKLGLLDAIPACTDLTSKPWVQEAGVNVLNQPFFARENIATAGGCLGLSTSQVGLLRDLKVLRQHGRRYTTSRRWERKTNMLSGCCAISRPI